MAVHQSLQLLGCAGISASFVCMSRCFYDTQTQVEQLLLLMVSLLDMYMRTYKLCIRLVC